MKIFTIIIIAICVITVAILLISKIKETIFLRHLNKSLGKHEKIYNILACIDDNDELKWFIRGTEMTDYKREK